MGASAKSNTVGRGVMSMQNMLFPAWGAQNHGPLYVERHIYHAVCPSPRIGSISHNGTRSCRYFSVIAIKEIQIGKYVVERDVDFPGIVNGDYKMLINIA